MAAAWLVYGTRHQSIPPHEPTVVHRAATREEAEAWVDENRGAWAERGELLLIQRAVPPAWTWTASIPHPKYMRVAAPRMPRVEVVKGTELPEARKHMYRLGHYAEVDEFKREPWDEGWKVTIGAKYLWEPEEGYTVPRWEELHRYERTFPKLKLEAYERLLREAERLARGPLTNMEKVHAAMLATRESFTPSVMAAFTGLTKQEAERAYTGLSGKDATRMAPAFLPNIFAESQRVLVRYVAPEYEAVEVLGRVVPAEAVIWRFSPENVKGQVGLGFFQL